MTSSPWLGINYSQARWTGYSKSIIDDDLDYLRQHFNHLRAFYPDYNDPAIAYESTKHVITSAKAKGFTVMWGITAANSGFNDSTWENFTARVKIEAGWANANGVDIFCVGNEEENHRGPTASDAIIRDRIRTLAGEVKALYPNLKIAYCIAQGRQPGWISDNNKGALDHLTLNCYGDEGNFGLFQNNISSLAAVYGSNTFISEWNIDSTWSEITTDEQTRAEQIALRFDYLKRLGIRAYFFAYQWNASGNPFSGRLLHQNEGVREHRPLWNVIISGRRWFF
jgi:hypothetical protein